MTKHDTWVKLIPDSPYQPILHLFPHGIPMRDPFPMERAKEDDEIVSLWIIDLDRLLSSQAVALTQITAQHHSVNPEEVAAEAISKGGFAMKSGWVASMECGPEGMQRTKELADFLESAPQPLSESAFQAFYNNQRSRWIDGDEVPTPFPDDFSEVDPRLQTPELKAAMTKNKINKMLAGYSVFDVLMGKAMTDILNTIDPDNEYKLVGLDDE
ncbi:hypothetical protein [Iningainema tapete]|uniref:Uncharacterized protein n=1 Tax=Iningainema tapete BLCC-T55 TaxID=2748662 RepID=A0A8J7C7I0_9CYAN|nr:hypothetical protein [Iningainema tapete]MBD2773191.1 hypothetical protein [Iningainema tapete BLCC-T55]